MQLCSTTTKGFCWSRRWTLLQTKAFSREQALGQYFILIQIKRPISHFFRHFFCGGEKYNISSKCHHLGRSIKCLILKCLLWRANCRNKRTDGTWCDCECECVEFYTKSLLNVKLFHLVMLDFKTFIWSSWHQPNSVYHLTQKIQNHYKLVTFGMVTEGGSEVPVVQSDPGFGITEGVGTDTFLFCMLSTP